MKLCQIIIAVIVFIILRVTGQEHEFTCGKRFVQHEGLITHGFQSNEGDWPWHAAIYHIGTNLGVFYKCGGSMLNSNSILTAAHCVFENNRLMIPDRVLVELGKYNLKISGTNSQQLDVFKIIPHPDFNTSDLSNDIAIIQLSTEATLNNYVQPICLWTSNKLALSEVIGKFGTVIGWGVTEMDKLSNSLREVKMPLVSLVQCLNSNRQFFGNFLSNKNFCAGFENGTSACNGDSGGSMSFEENGVYYIRGIVSLTEARKNSNLCSTKAYVIFTDVAQYLPWIKKMIPQLQVTLPKLEMSETTLKSDYINGKRFVLGLKLVNWFGAAQKCRYDSLQMASINSVEEQKVVNALIKSTELSIDNPFWTGGNDLENKSHWFWLSSGMPIQYFNWNNGEPNNGDGDERCIQIQPQYWDYHWNDVNCNTKTFFICEEFSIN